MTPAQFTTQLKNAYSNGYWFDPALAFVIRNWVTLAGYNPFTVPSDIEVLDQSAYSQPGTWTNVINAAYADGWTLRLFTIGNWVVLAKP